MSKTLIIYKGDTYFSEDGVLTFTDYANGNFYVDNARYDISEEGDILEPPTITQEMKTAHDILRDCVINEGKQYSMVEWGGMPSACFGYATSRADNETNAKALCNAIRAFAQDESALENFELYLVRHFDTWFSTYVDTPEGLVHEFERFATNGFFDLTTLKGANG